MENKEGRIDYADAAKFSVTAKQLVNLELAVKFNDASALAKDFSSSLGKVKDAVSSAVGASVGTVGGLLRDAATEQLVSAFAKKRAEAVAKAAELVAAEEKRVKKAYAAIGKKAPEIPKKPVKSWLMMSEKEKYSVVRVHALFCQSYVFRF